MMGPIAVSRKAVAANGGPGLECSPQRSAVAVGVPDGSDWRWWSTCDLVTRTKDDDDSIDWALWQRADRAEVETLLDSEVIGTIASLGVAGPADPTDVVPLVGIQPTPGTTPRPYCFWDRNKVVPEAHIGSGLEVSVITNLDGALVPGGVTIVSGVASHSFMAPTIPGWAFSAFEVAMKQSLAPALYGAAVVLKDDPSRLVGVLLWDSKVPGETVFRAFCYPMALVP